MQTEEIIANTIYELKQQFGETKITAATIHLVLKETIELVEHFSCPGPEKKEHVVTIVKVLVTDLVDNEEEKRIILDIIDKRILENTIDLIIAATKGKLNINKKTQKKLISCTTSIISIILRTVFHKKATSEKATSEKATSEKATAEKATSEKATAEKATAEKNHLQTPDTNNILNIILPL